MRSSFIILIFFTLGGSAFAQDIIETFTDDSIPAKITEITDTEIIYKNPANPNGPIYRTKITNVRRIIYQNGLIEYYNGAEPQTPINTTATPAEITNEKKIPPTIPKHIDEKPATIQSASTSASEPIEKKPRARPVKFIYMPAEKAKFAFYYMKTNRELHSSKPGIYLGIRSDFFFVANTVSTVNTRDIEDQKIPATGELQYYYIAAGESYVGRTSLAFGLVMNISESWLFVYSGMGIGQYVQYDLYDNWFHGYNSYTFEGKEWVRNPDKSNLIGVEMEAGIAVDFGFVLTAGFTSNNLSRFAWTTGIGVSF